ncbi:LIM/homeobox protein Awh isoform X2 [Folsomia candida]|nr:LIM/homeobox protein Awh isoform X2 [Folsomia candida]
MEDLITKKWVYAVLTITCILNKADCLQTLMGETNVKMEEGEIYDYARFSAYLLVIVVHVVLLLAIWGYQIYEDVEDAPILESCSQESGFPAVKNLPGMRISRGDRKNEDDAFVSKCAKCTSWISCTDWARRVRDPTSLTEQAYHMACFCCEACKQIVSTGEEFGFHKSKLLCKTHFEAATQALGEYQGGQQLTILQANFLLDSNPDDQDLERISKIAGISKLKTHVWFQDSRTRQKI